MNASTLKRHLFQLRVSHTNQWWVDEVEEIFTEWDEDEWSEFGVWCSSSANETIDGTQQNNLGGESPSSAVSVYISSFSDINSPKRDRGAEHSTFRSFIV